MANENRLAEILVSPNNTIYEVIERLDQVGCGVILVVDNAKKLLGTITDGDVRRAMLKAVSFETACVNICNRSPICASLSSSHAEVKRLFDNNPKMISLDQIPLLNDEGQVADLALRTNFMSDPKKENLVVIMAGGLGSRLSPLTLDCPKPLLQIAEKPLLEIMIENFIDEGFTNFLISVNYKADMIQKTIGTGSRWGVNIEYIYEDKALGTAGPLSLLREIPNQTFFVVNSDILTKMNFTKFLEFHNTLSSDATLCVREHEYVVPYGVVELSDHRLVHIQEKPVHSCFVSAGIYALAPSVLQYIPKNKYFDMNELLIELLSHEKSVNSYPIHEYWLDIGRIENLERAHQEYQHIFQ